MCICAHVEPQVVSMRAGEWDRGISSDCSVSSYGSGACPSTALSWSHDQATATPAVYKRDIERLLSRHAERVATAHAQLNIRAPNRYEFLDRRITKNHRHQHAKREIDCANAKLLVALEAIRGRPGVDAGDMQSVLAGSGASVSSMGSSTTSYRSKRGIHVTRKRQRARLVIDRENARLARKLTAIKPNYSMQDMHRYSREQQAVVNLRRTDHTAGHLMPGATCRGRRRGGHSRSHQRGHTSAGPWPPIAPPSGTPSVHLGGPGGHLGNQTPPSPPLPSIELYGGGGGSPPFIPKTPQPVPSKPTIISSASSGALKRATSMRTRTDGERRGNPTESSLPSPTSVSQTRQAPSTGPAQTPPSKPIRPGTGALSRQTTARDVGTAPQQEGAGRAHMGGLGRVAAARSKFAKGVTSRKAAGVTHFEPVPFGPDLMSQLKMAGPMKTLVQVTKPLEVEGAVGEEWICFLTVTAREPFDGMLHLSVLYDRQEVYQVTIATVDAQQLCADSGEQASTTGGAADPLELTHSDKELTMRLGQLFKEADTENKGWLDQKQFREVMNQAKLGLSGPELQLVMAEADENDNCEIEYCEFVPVALKLIHAFRARAVARRKIASESFALDEKVIHTMFDLEFNRLVSKLKDRCSAQDPDEKNWLPRGVFRQCLQDKALGLTKIEQNLLMNTMPHDILGHIDYRKIGAALDKVRYTTLRNSMAEAAASNLHAYLLGLCRDEERKTMQMDSPSKAFSKTEQPCLGLLRARQMTNVLMSAKLLSLSRLQCTSIMSEAKIVEGMVRYEEFVPVATKHIESIFSPENMRMRQQLVAKLDTNPEAILNGKGRDEIEKHLIQMYREQPELSVRDANGDGLTNLETFHECLMELNVGLSDDDINALWETADLDGNGEVSFVELAEFVYNCVLFLEREKHLHRMGKGLAEMRVHMDLNNTGANSHAASRASSRRGSSAKEAVVDPTLDLVRALVTIAHVKSSPTRGVYVVFGPNSLECGHSRPDSRRRSFVMATSPLPRKLTSQLANRRCLNPDQAQIQPGLLAQEVRKCQVVGADGDPVSVTNPATGKTHILQRDIFLELMWGDAAHGTLHILATALSNHNPNLPQPILVLKVPTLVRVDSDLAKGFGKRAMANVMVELDSMDTLSKVHLPAEPR